MRGNIPPDAAIPPGMRVVWSEMAEEMAAFDALPDDIRDLVRDAPVRLSAIGIAERIARHGAATVRAALRRQMANLPSPYITDEGARDGDRRSLLAR